MKQIIFLALIAFAGWQVYSQPTVLEMASAELEYSDTQEIQTDLNLGVLEIENAEVENFSVQFSCDGRQHCSQMTSRAEAVYFIQNCPNTKMDGDNDGIPCENDSRF